MKKRKTYKISKGSSHFIRSNRKFGEFWQMEIDQSSAGTEVSFNVFDAKANLIDVVDPSCVIHPYDNDVTLN